MAIKRSLGITALLILLGAGMADAQLITPRFSVSAGLAMPLRNEADAYGTGFHVGAGIKLPILPLQFEVAYDQMGADADGIDALKVTSAQAIVPIDLIPLPKLDLYALAGGGLYRAAGETDVGATAGAGVGIGSLFGEGRGVMVFRSGNKVTYLTAALGIRL